ncbi:MAG: DNA polymerase III subunit gamma/tau [Oligoflexales bacterium]|nr:DNA polymerase III subunit gamma/tau [Oligoflexales bacterium]
MAYLPLARKYRPHTFSDLVGQDAVAQALCNAIKLKREPHAVIFSGTRGIGKTTTARLYAKALNCTESAQADPCNACNNCLAINRGTHIDVVEIDGASNTSVDDVRDLQETLQYKPQQARFKVYIIDEVHMLSISAFNALLKSLEEPPEHVVFIFATTEIQKLPQTILSRCHSFHLRKMSPELISKRLEKILQTEEISFDPAALTVIALEGQGSMRDALTYLDQAIALGDGKLDLKSIREIFPYHTPERYLELLKSLLTKNAELYIELIDRFDQSGARFTKIVEETAKFSRNCFLVKSLKSAPQTKIQEVLIGFSPQETRQFIELADMAADFDLNRLFRMLVKCRSDLDGSSLDRFIVENYGLEWCLDPGLPLIDDLIANKSVLPLSQNKQSFATNPISLSQQKFANKPSLQNEQKSTADLPKSVPENLAYDLKKKITSTGEFPTDWRACVELWKMEKPLQARKLEEVIPLEFSPKRIVLQVNPKHLAAGQLLKPNAKQALRHEFFELFAFKGELEIIASENEGVIPSIASEKEQKKASLKEQLDLKARQNPLVLEIMQQFDAKIARIELNDNMSAPSP